VQFSEFGTRSELLREIFCHSDGLVGRLIFSTNDLRNTHHILWLRKTNADLLLLASRPKYFNTSDYLHRKAGNASFHLTNKFRLIV
jgi:hypothetical protein